jgi:outer membrane protein with beta-barrel domain
MKKLLLSLQLLFCALIINAQTNTGDWMIGGNLRINTTKSNNEFTFQPMGGYFFAKGFAAGAEVKLSFAKFGDEKSNTYGIGPFARYYFNLHNSSFKPLVHASFTTETVTTKSLGTKFRNTVSSLFLGLGGAYFINENVALEAVAGYNRSKYENRDSEGGFAFRFGFQVHLLGRQLRTVRSDFETQ